MKLRFFLCQYAYMAAVLSLLLVSCQRELDMDLTDRPTDDAPDSTLLIKFVTLDTTLPAPFDTVDYYSFEYDADDRIKKWYVVSPHDPDIDTILIGTYFYNGTDSLPYKREEVFSGDDIVLSSSALSYWDYDNTGRIVKDSSISIRRDDPPGEKWESGSARYTYTADGLNYHVQLEEFSVPATTTHERIIKGKIKNTVFNNCVTRQIDSMFFENPHTMDTMYCVSKADIVYDASPNPFTKVFPVNCPVYSLTYYTRFEEWDQPHNFITGGSQNQVYYSTGPTFPLSSGSSIETYEYRSDGYPIISRSTFTVAGTSYGTKQVYIYGR